MPALAPSRDGLTTAEAEARLTADGPNEVAARAVRNGSDRASNGLGRIAALVANPADELRPRRPRPAGDGVNAYGLPGRDKRLCARCCPARKLLVPAEQDRLVTGPMPSDQ